MSSDSAGWNAAMEIGKVGEQLVYDYYLSNGAKVTDLRNEHNAQRRDIDFEFADPYGHTLSVDVKTDTYTESNFFIEDRLVPTNWLGCFWKSRADLWLYLFTQTRNLYVLPLPELQRYVAERYEGLRRVQVRNYRDGRNGLTMEGLLLPVRTTVQNLGVEVIRLSEVSQDSE